MNEDRQGRVPRGWRYYRGPEETVIQLGTRRHVWKGRPPCFASIAAAWRFENECDCDECQPQQQEEDS